MITKEQINSFKKIIDHKTFSPLLRRLHYRKDKNVFVWTNSYILLEIPSRDEFKFDFSISYDDLKKFKKDIIWIEIVWDKARVWLLDWSVIEVDIEKNENFPDYEHIFDKSEKHYQVFPISPQYKTFFEVCDLLRFGRVITTEKNFQWIKDKMRICFRMPIGY